MKAAKLVGIVIAVIAALTFIQGGVDLDSIIKGLPLLGGHRPSFWYEVGGLVMILLSILALRRLKRPHEETSNTESGYEDADDDWYEADDDDSEEE